MYRMNGFFKSFCFLVYTYCIYQSYVFSIALVELAIKWDRLSWGLVEEGLISFFIVPVIIYQIILNPGFYGGICPLLCVYGGIFWLWWRHQSIFTAWLVALTGQFAGPAIFLFSTMPGDSGHRQPGLKMGMIGVEIFYISLLIANIVQKKFFPDNKIANRIRKILA